MKNSTNSRIRTKVYYLFMLAFVVLLLACKDKSAKEEISKIKMEEIVKDSPIYWNVKAMYPKGKSLDVKAFDNAGNSYDIMAIQDSDQDFFLDVKAIAGEEKLDVKMIESTEQFVPVKVISTKGEIYNVKAVTEEGEKLDIKGIRRFGNIIIMKAITKEGKYISVKAFSPDGKMNDIKGIKLSRGERDMVLRGVNVNAHVKAMHPAVNEEKFRMYKKSSFDKKREYTTDFERINWNVMAVTADGKNLKVKAIDNDGNQFDVLATQESEQHSFMNVKAFVDGYVLPVKIMQSKGKYAHVNAINSKGAIYKIKAISEDNEQFDVKGIVRLGRIIDIKVIDKNGDFLAVKAFAPDGKSNYISGIKILDTEVEMKVQQHSIYAHVKAINH